MPLAPSLPRLSASLPFALLALGLVAFGAQAQPSLSVQPGTAKPGDPVLVAVRGVEGMPSGTLAGRPLQFFETSGAWLALSGLPVEQSLGTVAVKVTAPRPAQGKALELAGTLDVVEPGYPERQLKVAGKYVKPPASVKARMAEDRAAFAAAFAQPFASPLFTENFAWPRQDRITAPYGDRRSFNGKLQSQHFGVDIDGNTGDSIFAANEGTVVMVRDCYSSGGTVIVHHGAGLYTTYFHMSRMDVKTGAKVQQGQKLGLVGKTGRVTGPHLHWGVKLDGLWVDGLSLLKLDFFGKPEPRVATTETPAALPSPAPSQNEGTATVTATP
ncbi:M23 family metallopeptidase [Hyalangium minutum]|uniref:Peptidase, M23/M37 family protein n=1 Tax=Hyalangium minutum TaxID=394096 RepID=A0A085WAM0_9BACT|nr:M23 family metallopeptidase [Hyalangium minutum]KFE64733.1 peptidase, M23/M37 family protein [Hyalangium minutum]